MTTQEFGPTLKRHHLTALPQYVILHIKRFTKNNFVEEKNPTIVNFPLSGIDMGPCESSSYASLTPDVDPKPSDPLHTVYDLLSNVTIDSTIASTTSGDAKREEKEVHHTTWKMYQRCGAGGGDDEKWFEMQDLRVDEVRREMVSLGETVLQVWQRKDLAGK